MLRTRIFPCNPLQTNCVVVWADGNSACTVVDPGMSSPQGSEELKECFASNGITPAAILLTHGHFDHVWGVEKLLALYDVPVYMHPEDKHIMEQLAAGFMGMESFRFLKHDFPTKDLADGDLLPVAGVNWKVLHTPGHTPGSVCFWAREDNLLLSGDTLFAGSIGRTDLAGGDYDLLMDSLLHKVMLLPEETDIIPGHGQPTSIAREAHSNPFLQPFNEPDADWTQDGISIRGQ